MAEFVLAALLENLRELGLAKAQAEAGNYSESGFTGSEIKGKKLAVIGLGHIGKRVAELSAQGFGAKASYWDRTRREAIGEEPEVKFMEIDKLLQESGIISLHLALNEETRVFLNAERIGLIRPGAIVINTAPMELMDIEALQGRLAKGDITLILDRSDELSAGDAPKLAMYKNCVIYHQRGMRQEKGDLCQ